MKKIAVVIFVLVALVLSSVLVEPVEAKSGGAYINGPTHARVGKEYAYNVGCRGISTEYIEVAVTQRVGDPQIVVGGGSLIYDLDQYPGTFSWFGDPSGNVKLRFNVDPAFSTVGAYTFTISVECLGYSDYDFTTMEVEVRP